MTRTFTSEDNNPLAGLDTVQAAGVDTDQVVTEVGSQLEVLAAAADIAAGVRPREDSQAIGVGILAVGEGILSCPVVEHRTVVAGTEVVHTARVAFHKVAEEVSRMMLRMAFHIATGVACRSPEAAFRNLGVEAAGRTYPFRNPSSRLAVEGNSQPGADHSP